ncbi:hypothetical protein, partial [Rhodopirellula bahusiensis]
MKRPGIFLALLILCGCHRSPPPRPPLDPGDAIAAIRTSEYVSAHVLLRDATRDLTHAAIGKPWDDVADAFERNAQKHLSRGTSTFGDSPEHKHQTSLVRTISVGELEFQLQCKIEAINQPGSLIDECDVVFDLAQSLDSSAFLDGTAVPTDTVLDDIFETERFQEHCRNHSEISYITIRFQRISHGRQQYYTKGFVVTVGFRESTDRTTASLTFRAESGLEPA